MGESKRRKGRDNGWRPIYPNLTAEKRREIIRRANEATDLACRPGVDHGAWYREQFQADIVYGIWKDASQPGKVAIALLKGWGRLKLISQHTKGVPCTLAEVRFLNEVHATATGMMLGDGRSFEAA